MPRRKAAQNVLIKPWLSTRQDCREGRFIQVGNSLLLNKRVQSLSAGAFRLYLGMCMESGGVQHFTFTHGDGRKYGVPNSSYDRYILELVEVGLVERVMDENLSRFKPNEFRFIFTWK